MPTRELPAPTSQGDCVSQPSRVGVSRRISVPMSIGVTLKGVSAPAVPATREPN